MMTPTPEPLNPESWMDTSGARVRVLPPALFAAPLALTALLSRRRERSSAGKSEHPGRPHDAATSGERRPRKARQLRKSHKLRKALRPVLAVLAVATGAVVMAWAFLTMRAHRTTVVPWARVDALVTDGPFAHVRNPIYSADVLIYLGVSLWLRSWGPVLALPGVLAILHRWVIAPEEEYLAEQFGRRYRAYVRRTPRLVPALPSRS